MDAEEYYESRRLKDEEMADKRDERKAHEIAFYAKEITGIFEDFFAPGGGRHVGLRLPAVHDTPVSGYGRAAYDVPVVEAIAEAVSLDGDPMRLLLEACRAESPDLTSFREACVKAYLEQHLDDLAECELERQDREGTE